MFDETHYQGAIAADLFGDERFFTDAEEFWRLQNAAIADERERLLAARWPEVHIVEPDRRFQLWDYDKLPKSRGGAVYIDVEPDGQVNIHKGLLPRKEAQRSLHIGCNGEASLTAATLERPELSAPLANYIDLVRLSAVRLAIADAPKIALRLMLAHVIGGGRHWTIEIEPQRPATPAIGDTVAALPTHCAFVGKRREISALLGLDEADADIVSHGRDGARTATVFTRLLDVSDTDVMRILAVVMAETLAAGTSLTDTVGTILKVDVAQHWQPDDTFFDLLRDREAVSAMLSDVVGDSAAKVHLTETGSKKKAIIRKALTGDGRSKVERWTPKYLTFPQSGYTSRRLKAAPQLSA